MSSYRLWLALPLLGCFMLGGAAMASPLGVDQTPRAPDQVRPDPTRLSQAQPAPTGAPAAAAPAQAASDEPIGNVAALTGIATVIRNKDSIALKLRDDIYLNDIVQTSTGSSLGITFNDATTFNLSANAKITIDTYVYEDGGSQNAGAFDIAKGTVAFVAAAVAKTGDMKITTPTASLGIRGTTGVVDVPEGATPGANNVAIKLYPDADGRVGRIEVNDRVAGTRLGALTQGASGFSIRPGMGGGARFAAVPLAISPREAARDQGFVRQVHATQTIGRQVVTEQRAFRRANPGLNNPNRGNQPGATTPNRGNQPGPERQNGLPGQNRPGQNPTGRQQPLAPNRPGTQQPGQPPRPGQNPQGERPGQPERPGENQLPGQPGQPQRPGQNPQGERPATPPPAVQPRQGGLQQGRPGVQRPALPNKPALRRPPPPPKGKKKEQR